MSIIKILAINAPLSPSELIDSQFSKNTHTRRYYPHCVIEKKISRAVINYIRKCRHSRV